MLCPKQHLTSNMLAISNNWNHLVVRIKILIHNCQCNSTLSAGGGNCFRVRSIHQALFKAAVTQDAWSCAHIPFSSKRKDHLSLPSLFPQPLSGFPVHRSLYPCLLTTHGHTSGQLSWKVTHPSISYATYEEKVLNIQQARVTCSIQAPKYCTWTGTPH